MISILTSVLVVFTMLFVSGCAHPFAAVQHPAPEKVVLVKSSDRNVLLSVDKGSRTFTYWSKDDAKGCYFITTYDREGRVIDKVAFPRFSQMCWLNFGYAASYSGSVSPDCKSVVYLDVKNSSSTNDADLCCFDARTGTRKVVASGLTSKGNYLACLRWVSETEVLVAVDDPYKPGARLLFINSDEASIRLDVACKGFRTGQFALSHSKRYLAYWEGVGKYKQRGSFRIIDLKNGNEIAVTEPGEPAVHGEPKWSPNDDALLFVMDGKLIRYSLASRHSEVLKSFDPHEMITLQDYEGTRVFYRRMADNNGDATLGFRYFDLATREEGKLQHGLNGIWSISVFPDSTTIYYKLGQEPL